MDAYNAQCVGAATVALGIARAALACCRLRQAAQAGRQIAKFQGLPWLLAGTAVAIELARLMVWRAARSPGPAGFPDPVLAARTKILAAETAVKLTNDALHIWGAAGYARANPMERQVRDARKFTLAGGTAQILRNLGAGHVLGMRPPRTRNG